MTATWLLILTLAGADPGALWKPHDPDRPQPAVVTPAICRTGVSAVPAPDDAVVLFDGRDLSEWVTRRGTTARWAVRDGYMEVVPRSGAIFTRQAFGDCQLHLEVATPNPPQGDGQDRGNSGIKFMGIYEIQVLDSYHNPTYADGIAGAVYSEHPPLVNASCPPGRWESYDIVFHAPRFSASGVLEQAATVTVFLNGILVQDHATISGPTSTWPEGVRQSYRAHAARLPLELQDHQSPVRYRNVWLRELAGAR